MHLPHTFSQAGLQALQRLSITLGATLSIQDESASFLEWVVSILSPSVVALFVRSETDETLHFIEGSPSPQNRNVPLPMGFNPWKWLETQGIAVHHEAQYVIPLSVEGEIFGILCLARPESLNETSEQVLDIAATMLSSILRNIQRYRDVEALVEERTAALRASEERYRLISETVSDFAYAARVTEDGTIIPEWVTDSFYRVSGYKPRELTALDGWTPIIVKEDLEVGQKRRGKVLAGQSDVGEFRVRFKDGSVHWLRDFTRPVWDEKAGRVVRLYGAAQDITAYKQAQQALEQSAAEANALLETAGAITSLNLEQVLNTIIQRARELFQADGSRIHLLEADGYTLHCVVAHHDAAGQVMAMPIHLGEGFTGKVAAEGKARIINDTEAEDEGMHVPGTPAESEALMLAPLQRGEKIIGVMTVSRVGTERPFSQHDLKLLQAFAAQAAIAIANAQLYEKRRHFASQIQAVNQLAEQLLNIQQAVPAYVAVCEMLSHLTPSIQYILISRQERELRPVYVWEKGTENARPQPLPAHSPLLALQQQAADSRRLQSIAAAPAAVCAPLVHGERTFGTLSVVFSEEHILQEEDTTLVNVIASLLASALENIRLFDELHHQLEHIRTLHLVDRAISASVDLDVTLKVILEQIRIHLQADITAVFLLDTYMQHIPCRTLDGLHGGISLRQIIMNTRSPVVRQVLLSQQPATIYDREVLKTVFVSPQWLAQENIVCVELTPLIAKGQTRGILGIFYRHECPAHPKEHALIQAIARQTALGVEHIQLFEQLQHTTLQLAAAQDQVLEHWALLVEAHGQEPSGATLNMANIAVSIGQMLHLSDEDIHHLRRGILLHDIGMLLIPEVNPRRDGPLSEEERRILKEHPYLGYEFLKPLEFLQPALDVVRHHHERWNGSGYPHGLSGADIPLNARIAAVADVWTAMTSLRPYRPALAPKEALQIIQAQAGKAFDPQVVEALSILVQS